MRQITPRSFLFQGPALGSYTETNGVVDLSVSGTTVRSALTIASAGPFNLDGIIVSGGLGSLTAEHTAISGNLTILGRVPSITVGSVSGGTWAVAGGIGSLKILGDLTAASIFAGANSGTDHVLGNADDTFLATQIISIFVGGSDTSSIIAAGIAPTDGINVFNGVTPIPGGKINSIVVRGSLDASSRILSAALPKTASLTGAPIGTTSDSRFQP